ncbi:MAG: cupin domain-containing protein [Solirubrobacteraceae bacterium]
MTSKGEARLEQTAYGLTAATDGWFVVNVREAAWMTNKHFGDACVFEGDAVAFPDVGYTIHVLRPGQPNGLYHHERDQEDFLVLAGECIAIVEGEERRMKRWDFLHCPPGTEHIFVGAGEGPCVIFMAGGREHRGSAVYIRSELALGHGASVESEARPSDRPYMPFPKWQPGPPASFDGLPFG